MLISSRDFFVGPDLAGAEKPPVLAWGDLRGHVMPCGCDPLTDMGGIARIGRGLERWRALRPLLITVDLGQNTDEVGGDLLKSQTIVRAMARWRADATLLNRAEYALLKKIHGPWKKHGRALAFVLSNSLDPLPAGVKRARVKHRTLIMGYTEGLPVSRSWSPELRRSWEAAFLKNKKSTDRRLLLFAGKPATAAAIAATGLFDRIILSSTLPADAEPDKLERDEPGRLVTDAGMMVPSFGQGMLLLDDRKPVLGSAAPTCPPGGMPTLDKGSCRSDDLLGAGGPVIWLDRSYKDDGVFDDLLAWYRHAEAGRFQQAGREREKDLKNSPFAGAEACRTCHAVAFSQWQKSAHAGALVTLEKKQLHENAECVSCHVVGWHDKGGFVSRQASPWLAGVQCENCHGPRRRHVADPLASTKGALRGSAAGACAACHNATHSPTFDFDSFWKRIAH